MWIRQTASLVQTGPGPLGAYRTVKREQALGRWMTGAPEDRSGAHSRRLVRRLADATFASDPEGSKMNPPVLRAPNDVMEDGSEFFGAGSHTTTRPKSRCRRC